MVEEVPEASAAPTKGRRLSKQPPGGAKRSKKSRWSSRGSAWWLSEGVTSTPWHKPSAAYGSPVVHTHGKHIEPGYDIISGNLTFVIHYCQWLTFKTHGSTQPSRSGERAISSLQAPKHKVTSSMAFIWDRVSGNYFKGCLFPANTPFVSMASRRICSHEHKRMATHRLNSMGVCGSHAFRSHMCSTADSPPLGAEMRNSNQCHGAPRREWKRKGPDHVLTAFHLHLRSHTRTTNSGMPRRSKSTQGASVGDEIHATS